MDQLYLKQSRHNVTPKPKDGSLRQREERMVLNFAAWEREHRNNWKPRSRRAKKNFLEGSDDKRL